MKTRMLTCAVVYASLGFVAFLAWDHSPLLVAGAAEDPIGTWGNGAWSDSHGARSLGSRTQRLAGATGQPAASPPAKGMPRPKFPPMQKYVSEKANFALYVPKGWRVAEESRPGLCSLLVQSPDERYHARMFFGLDPERNPYAIGINHLRAMNQKYPDFKLGAAIHTKERTRFAFEGTFADRKLGKRAFRLWVSSQDGSFVLSRIDAPDGELEENKGLLLSILANVFPIKGALEPQGQGPAPVRLRLVGHRLRDGSASFTMPQDWKVQDLGKTSFIASDPRDAFVFMSATAFVMTPAWGKSSPGVPVAPYMPPSRALPHLAGQGGLMQNVRLEEVVPRPDQAREAAVHYTTGQVTVEEFLFTYTNRSGQRCRAYSYGTTYDTRLQYGWTLWHITVSAPAEQFNAFVPTFSEMIQSYTIDDRWAKNYIAQGMARWRQLVAETSQKVAQISRDIADINRSIYENNARSKEYLDYQRTRYIRGEQDWISQSEGGAVYRSDSWGLQNLTTGGYVAEGEPYNYVHFTGQQHGGDMVPINSRELYERHIRGAH